MPQSDLNIQIAGLRYSASLESLPLSSLFHPLLLSLPGNCNAKTVRDLCSFKYLNPEAPMRFTRKSFDSCAVNAQLASNKSARKVIFRFNMLLRKEDAESAPCGRLFCDDRYIVTREICARRRYRYSSSIIGVL